MTTVVLEIEQRTIAVNAVRQELGLTDSEVVRFRFAIESLRLAMWEFIISENPNLHESTKYFLIYKTREYTTESLPTFAPIDLSFYLIDAEERLLMDQLFKFKEELPDSPKITLIDFWGAIYSFRLALYRKKFSACQNKFSLLAFAKIGEVLMAQFTDRTSLKTSGDAKDIMQIAVEQIHKSQQNIWEKMLA